MTSKTLGKNISEVEVSNISHHGIWLFVTDTEYFLPYGQFPWFRDSTVKQICDVQLLHGYHLFWPQLDVDLELGSLKSPEAYPLTCTVEQKMEPTSNNCAGFSVVGGAVER